MNKARIIGSSLGTRFGVLGLMLVGVAFSGQAALIAHWTFDESTEGQVVDLVAGYTGVLNGGVTRIPGKVGAGALQFDGDSGYVEISSSINSPLELVDTPYTISFFAKYEGSGPGVARAINMDDGEDYSGGYSIVFYPGATVGLGLTHNSDHQPQNSNVALFSGAEWQHIAVVWDGTTRLVYVDGLLRASLPTVGNLTSDHDDPLWFGSIPKYGQYFQGALDDIRIYDSALTAEEVGQLLPEPPILITQPPIGVTLREKPEGRATFTASAQVLNDRYPASELQFQWQKNGADIPGATGSSYEVVNPSTADTGTRYRVVVSHPSLIQVAASAEALLVVLDSPLPTLLSEWKFDEGSGTTALDTVGSQNGTIIGATYIPGPSGTALAFNGSGDHVEVGGIGTALELVDTPYTIAWWQRWTGGTGSQRVINMDDANDYSAGYSIFLASGSFSLTHNNGLGDPQNWGPGVVASTNWQHVALVWDGTVRTLYLDGVARASIATTEHLFSDGDDPLWFGGIEVHGQFFNGALDEIRIYQGAFATDEVPALAGVVSEVELTIEIADDGSVLLSWPAAAAGYRLEATAALGAGVSWTSAGTPSVVGDRNTVTVDTTTAASLYRLIQP